MEAECCATRCSSGMSQLYTGTSRKAVKQSDSCEPSTAVGRTGSCRQPPLLLLTSASDRRAFECASGPSATVGSALAAAVPNSARLTSDRCARSRASRGAIADRRLPRKVPTLAGLPAMRSARTMCAYDAKPMRPASSWRRSRSACSASRLPSHSLSLRVITCRRNAGSGA